MPVTLLIFDLDGTLVDTLPDITNSLNYAFRKKGLDKTLTCKQVKGLVGEGITRLIEKAVADKPGGQGLVEDLTEAFLAHYRNHLLDHSYAYPDVPETLKNLNGFKKAVISNKQSPFSKKILKGLGLDGYFDLVVGPDTTGERKPQPGPILYVLEKLKTQPGEAVLTGDSKWDIEAGRRAGVKCTVAVTYGYGNGDGATRCADYVVDRMGDLISTLYKNEPMLERRKDPCRV